MKKLALSLFLMIALSLSGFAQNSKMKEKAMEKVEELNEQIVAGDQNLALTKDQREKVYQLELSRLTEVQKARKASEDKEKIKEINQKYFKEIFNDVLTKEQKKARKAGKDETDD